MANNQVNTAKIYEITNDINNIIKNITNDLEKINGSCDSLVQNCTEFQSYHGQEVMGSRNERLMQDLLGDENTYTEITWEEWSISGCENILATIRSVQKGVVDLKDATDGILSLTETSQSMADFIDMKINNLQKTLGDYTNEEIFVSSGLITKMALDEYQAADNQWVGIKDENVKWWTDNPLRFVKATTEDGRISYRVDQKDENGNWVGMGFTDGETAYNYLLTASEDVTQKKVAQENLVKNMAINIAGGAALSGTIGSLRKNDKSEFIFEVDPSNTKSQLRVGVVNPEKQTYTKYYRYNDNNEEGKISEIYNQNTGVTKTLYSAQANSKGKKEEILNKDGSSVTKYDSSENFAGMEKEIRNTDGSAEFHYDSTKNKKGIEKININADGSRKIEYNSSVSKDAIQEKTWNADGSSRENYDTSQSPDRLSVKINNPKNQTQTSYFENNNEGKLSEVHNEITGETKTLYGASKNPDGKIQEIQNTDGSAKITYEPSMSKGGIKEEVWNTDGSAKIIYEPSMSRDGIKEEIGNTDGSVKLTYEPSISKDGIKEEIWNTDGSQEILYNSSLREDGLEREIIDTEGNITPFYEKSEEIVSPNDTTNTVVPPVENIFDKSETNTSSAINNATKGNSNENTTPIDTNETVPPVENGFEETVETPSIEPAFEEKEVVPPVEDIFDKSETNTSSAINNTSEGNPQVTKTPNFTDERGYTLKMENGTATLTDKDGNIIYVTDGKVSTITEGREEEFEEWRSTIGTPK